MSTILLHCPDCPGLKLGPGLPTSKNVVVFVDGYAALDTEDPLYAQKVSWTHAFGTPPISIVDPDEDVAAANDPNAIACPSGCGALFVDDRAVDRHLLETRCRPRLNTVIIEE